MALTRPRITSFNTTVTSFNDPLVVLNSSATTANTDIGFILNRNGGTSSNTAIYWSELNSSFILAYTNDSGSTNSNVTIVSSYADLSVGNLTTNGKLISTVSNGITPMTITSTTLVSNLNSDLLDGMHSATAATASTIVARDSTGNVAANYFTGNGSLLTGITATATSSYSNTNVASYLTSTYAFYSNSNVTAYLSSNSIGPYSNTNVSSYLPTYTSAFGNVTGITSSGTIQTTGIVYGNSGVSGTLLTAAQTNVTSLGNLTSLSVGGTSSHWGAATFYNGITGTLQTASQPNITSVGTLTSLALSGAITGATGVTATNLTGTLQTAAQTNITSVGTLTGLSVGTSAVSTFANTTNAISYNNAPVVVSGGLGVAKDVYIQGNLYVANVVSTTSQTLVVQDPLVYFSSNTVYPYNYDIGFYSHFIGGPANVYAHTGFVRNDSDSKWYLFSNIGEPAGGQVDIANANVIYDQIVTGAHTVYGAVTGNANIAQNLGSTSQWWNNTYTNALYAPSIYGTLQTAAQTNITSVGNLTSLSASGTIQTTGIVYGNSGVSGTLLTASQPNITGVGTITSGTWSGSFGAVSGANLTSLTAGNLSGTIPSAVLGNSTHYVGTTAIALNRASASQSLTGVSIDGSAATVTGATQSAITAVGNLTSLSVAGTSSQWGAATFYNTISANTATFSTANTAVDGMHVYSVSANTVGQLNLHSVSGLNNRMSKIKFWGTFYNIPADTGERYVTSIRSGFDSTQTAWGSEYLSVYVNNTVNDSNADSLQSEIVRFTNYQGLTVYKDIRNGQTSGTGNIGATGATFNTVFAKATTATYADLAEIYVSDNDYKPGTVVIFGGNAEITISTLSHDPSIAGVISTNPAHVMNSQCDGLPVALQGRVPTLVQGPVNKGDRVVSSNIPGVAYRLDKSLYEPGCIIGKSLETIKTNEIKTIEIVVGRN